MKKLISILLVLCMCASALALASCDLGDGTVEDDTTAKTEEPTKKEEKTTKADASEDEETTTKDSATEENTTEESTTEESTTEENTTESTVGVKLTEEEWYALANLELYSNFTIITTQIDNFYKTVSETKVVDGHVFLSYTTYNQSTGASNTNSGDASLEHVDKTIITPDLKDYSKIEYDAERGVYFYTEPIEITDVSNPNSPLTITYTKYEWTLKDGKIHTIYNEFWYMDAYYGKISATQTAEYKDYGTTVAPYDPTSKPTPPEVKNEVTAEEWMSAFALETDYLQVKAELYSNDTLLMWAASNRALNIIQTIDSDLERMAIDYLVKVDGGWYYYNDCTESADVDAERRYEKWFQSPEDCHGDDEFENTKNSPRDMISAFAEEFDSFSYDENKGGYFASSVGYYENVLIVFDEDKNIQTVIYGADVYEYKFEFSYDEFNIFLPDATEVER